MNIVSEVFGIFSGEGLVLRVKEQKKLLPFIWAVIFCIVVLTSLYGLAMGISVNLKIALRDALKVPAIFILTLAISYPAYFVPLKIVGLKETNRQILAIILTMFFTASLLLSIAAPIIFFYGLASEALNRYYFIHIVIIDLALLAGLLVMGVTLNKTIDITDKSSLVVPVIVGTIFVGLALWVLILFWGPYFEPTEYLSRGIERIYELLMVDGVR